MPPSPARRCSPPSPAMRCSPGREPMTGNHIRGRSLEGFIPYREKDDDLALFNEVQSKETDNFLLHSNDDFEDLFSSKLRYFSDHKLGIPKPSHGESSDLLNADGEKNDYDWLLTPPDTPLFTSLDDETPPVSLPLRGRPRSQPISISRSSTMERSHRSSRGSASPNRLSLSPRSSHSTSQSRGRPSSLPGTSPPPSLGNATPTRRPSPPPTPSKPSTAVGRSSTPSPRRMSTGSSGPAAPSWVRGNSPAKSEGRISPSPKIKAWQANIPGFSSEVPPNLRTSLGDRPASYVRGSSPASRNGSKPGRQSMSPTASRSVGSSHSHERDKLSFNSKGSVASSGDDDMESLLSIPVSSSDRSSPRNLNTSLNNRNLNSSKKPTRIVTSSSAPKRSFDMAIRQMDHQKGPYNMFRPLLSSVPSSTFNASNSGAMHHTTASRNSSVTTSSNASSDLGFSVGHGIEASEPKQEDRDQVDSIREDQIHEDMPHRPHDEINDRTELDTLLVGDATSKGHDMTMEISAASEVLYERGDLSTESPEDIVFCSNCGSVFRASEIIEGEPILCKDCEGSGVFSGVASVPNKDNVDTDSPGLSGKDVDQISECGTSYNEEEISYSELHGNLLQGRDVGQNSAKEGESVPTRQMLIDPHTVNSCIVDEENRSQKLLNSDVTEGIGIPLLLRSSSSKGPIHRSRTFNATSMNFDDFSQMRDSATSTRSSFGHGSASASSSIDLGSSKQSETRFPRQSNGRKSDNEGYKSEYVKHQHSISSLSETSTPALPVSSIEASCYEENFEVSADNAQEVTVNANCMELQERALLGEAQEGDGVSIDISECNGNLRTVSDLSSSSMSIHVRNASVASASNFEDSDLQESGKNLTSSGINAIEQVASSTHPKNCTDRVDIAETEEHDVVSPDSVFDVGSQNSKSSLEDLQEPSHSVASVEEKHAQSTIEESDVMLDDGLGGNHNRSFTLEEATDAILFCRSIVHNLAYEAACLAIEKDSSVPLEVLQPVATFVGKSNPNNRKDLRSRTVAKRNSKSQKPVERAVETDPKPPIVDNASDERDEVVPSTRIVGANKGDTAKPLKLESKCNCVIM